MPGLAAKIAAICTKFRRECVRHRPAEWMVENLGEWMYSYFGHDRTYVIDDEGKLVHAMRDGDTVVPSSFSGDRDAVAGFFSQLRGRLAAASIGGFGFPAREEVFLAETTLVNQRPAVVSVRPIVPSTDRMTLPAGSEYFHASIKFMDRKAEYVGTG